MRIIAVVFALALLPLAVEARGFVDVTNKERLFARGVLRAFGDYDSNLHTDLLMAEGHSVVILSGDNFDELNNITLSCEGPCSVTNVIAGDMNWDGMLDVLVQYSTSDNGVLKNVVFLQQYGDGGMREVTLPETADQFLAANMFGELYVDLIGTLVLHDGERKPAIFQNLGCGELEPGCPQRYRCYVPGGGSRAAGCTEVIDLAELGLQWNDGRQFYEPHESATVDLNGDCAADFVLSFAFPGKEGRIFQFLKAIPGAPPFVKVGKELHVPASVGFVSWYDVDSDGDMDMIAPLCSADCERAGKTRYDALITIANQQPHPGCDGYSCCNEQNFWFADVSNGWKGLEHEGVRLTWLPKGTWLEGAVGCVPVVRAMDYNNDGAADVVLAMTRDAGSMVQLWQGTTNTANAGTFTPAYVISMTPKGDDPKPVPAWFDLHEDGVVDLLVSFTAAQTISVFQNELHETNHLFFKALGLNGKCHRKCSTEPHNPDPPPYGVNMPGVTHKFFFNIPSGMSTRSVYMTGVQLTQSQQLSLQAAYNSWGLGDTNSYIETYFCGYHVRGKEKAYRSWPAILPNSQIIVTNYPMDEPSEWTIELFISPSRYILGIVIATATTLFALAIPILVLRCRELKEDAVEQRKDRFIMPM